MSAKDDMWSLLEVPTVQKAREYKAKYNPESMAELGIRTIMEAIYKARIKLNIDKVASYAWLKDNGFNLEVPDRITESDANDIDLTD